VSRVLFRRFFAAPESVIGNFCWWRLAAFCFDFATCLLPMSVVLTVRSTGFFPDFVRALSHAFLVLHRFPQPSSTICHRFYPSGMLRRWQVSFI
jgi:hypothetical protein